MKHCEWKSVMKTVEYVVRGPDGADARLTGYVIGNSRELDPNRVRPAVLVLPGGGYHFTSDTEDEPIAVTLLGFGFQVFSLRYSVAPYRYPVALCEVAEAIRLLRKNSAEWHIDPDAIVVVGFSAGAHLAGCLGVSWNLEDGALHDHGFIPQQIRPNGLMLGYPVVTSGEYAHRGSMQRLLGDSINDPDMLDAVSVEKHVNSDMPPTFLWHTITDELVPVENSLMLINALHRAHVSVEAHLYESGHHGLSLGGGESAVPGKSETVEPCVQSWTRLFALWMSRHFTSCTPFLRY